MNDDYHKAYKEVLHILDSSPKEMVDKIPENVMEVFRANADENYECDFDINDENVELLDETKNILGMIYYKYWCEDEEEKAEFEKMMEENEKNENQEK
jgi:hypothetical protein